MLAGGALAGKAGAIKGGTAGVVIIAGIGGAVE